MMKIIKESKAYLYHIRKYIWFSLVVFVLAALAGFYIAQFYPDQIRAYLAEAEEFFASMQSPTLWGTFLMIMQNNIETMLMVVFMGLFLGIFSLTFLFANGIILGVFAYIFYSQGASLIFFFGIAPHGIIEIPCMLFSAAIGLKIGKTVIGKIFRKKESLTAEVASGLRFAALIIVPSLVVAAFIETYITPFFIVLVQSGFGIETPLLF